MSFLENSFREFQLATIPRFAALSPEQRERSWTTIRRQLDAKPAALGVAVAAFFVLIDLFSLLTRLRRFHSLGESQKTRVLTAFFDSPIPLIRKGFWGINTLAKLGVYSQESIYESIHYKRRPNS